MNATLALYKLGFWTVKGSRKAACMQSQGCKSNRSPSPRQQSNAEYGQLLWDWLPLLSMCLGACSTYNICAIVQKAWDLKGQSQACQCQNPAGTASPDGHTRPQLPIITPLMQSQAQHTTKTTNWGCASQITTIQPQHLPGQQLPVQLLGAGLPVVGLACLCWLVDSSELQWWLSKGAIHTQVFPAQHECQACWCEHQLAPGKTVGFSKSPQFKATDYSCGDLRKPQVSPGAPRSSHKQAWHSC